jgi:hypothetical protein
VTFTKPGDYRFRLRAYDGGIAVNDTIMVSVAPAIPFLVLRPAESHQVLIGGVDTVTWQIDPPAEVIVELSVDNGITYADMVGSNVPAGTTSWAWQVPDTLPVSDSCFVRVTDYLVRTRQATSAAFRLVTTIDVARRQAGVKTMRPAPWPIEVYGIDGRRLDPALLTQRSCGTGASVNGVVICRFRGGEGRAARIVLMPR